jgi:hypothetical protein
MPSTLAYTYYLKVGLVIVDRCFAAAAHLFGRVAGHLRVHPIHLDLDDRHTDMRGYEWET